MNANRLPISSSMEVGRQLLTMLSFARARTSTDLLSIWSPTQRVLTTHRINAHAFQLPIDDGEVPAFQKNVLESTCMPVSNSIAALFEDHRVEEIARLLSQLHEAKELSPDNIQSFEKRGIIAGYAAAPLMASAELYLKLGSQMEVALKYFTSRDAVPDELLWQIKLVFAVNGLTIDHLESNAAGNPRVNFHLNVALQRMVQREFEQRLPMVTRSNPSWSDLKRNHNITPSLLKRLREASLVTRNTMMWIEQNVVAEPILEQLIELVRTHPGSSILAGGIATSSLAGAVVNIVLGGSTVLTGGLATLPFLLGGSALLYLVYAKR